MTNAELVEFLATQSFTRMQALNLVIADLFDSVPSEMVEQNQRLVSYYNYKITECLLPALEKLKGKPKHPSPIER